jgi:hypothetical protein
MTMTILSIIAALVYLAGGLAKLRYFDRNGEATWLVMLADDRHGFSPIVVIAACVAAVLTWPVGVVNPRLAVSPFVALAVDRLFG